MSCVRRRPVNDLLIVAKTLDRHLEHLVGDSEVDYLGFNISEKGTRPSKKVEA